MERYTRKFGGNSGLKDRNCISAKEVSVIDGKLVGEPIDRMAELEELHIAKKPFIWGDGYADGQLIYDMYNCPNCEKEYELDYEQHDYCPKCGQKIDWSEYEG